MHMHWLWQSQGPGGAGMRKASWRARGSCGHRICFEFLCRPQWDPYAGAVGAASRIAIAPAPLAWARENSINGLLVRLGAAHTGSSQSLDSAYQSHDGHCRRRQVGEAAIPIRIMYHQKTNTPVINRP